MSEKKISTPSTRLNKREGEAYGYASRLAEGIWRKHYQQEAPKWACFDNLMGVLTQIDNMVTGLTKKPDDDAARFRWLADRLLSVDFDWQDSGECVLVFRYPAWGSVSADARKTIDSGMRESPPLEHQSTQMENEE